MKRVKVVNQSYRDAVQAISWQLGKQSALVEIHKVIRQVSRNNAFCIHKQNISNQSITHIIMNENQNIAYSVSKKMRKH